MARSLGFSHFCAVARAICGACQPDSQGKGEGTGVFASKGNDECAVVCRRRSRSERIFRAGKSAWICTFLVLLACRSVMAEVYTLHAGPNGYAPFFIVNNDGERTVYTGAMYDLLDMFENRHPEYTRENILLTRKRANLGMARGEVFDMMFNSPLFVSEEILEHYKFTRPIFRSRDVVITLQDQEFEYQKPENLYGKKVATIRGYGYGEFDQLLESEVIRDIRVDQHTQAIGMLAKGRVDAYFGNALVSPHYIKQMGLAVSDFNLSAVSMYEFDLGFAVNRKKPELYKKLNKFIDDVVFNGVLDRLMKSYLE